MRCNAFRSGLDRGLIDSHTKGTLEMIGTCIYGDRGFTEDSRETWFAIEGANVGRYRSIGCRFLAPFDSAIACFIWIIDRERGDGYLKAAEKVDIIRELGFCGVFAEHVTVPSEKEIGFDCVAFCPVIDTPTRSLKRHFGAHALSR